MSKNLLVDNLIIGDNVKIHPTAVIRGPSGNAKSIKIGDNVFIGANVQIICDEFKIGDYSKIQHNTNIHGYKPCHIGYNAWIGQYSIIDCIGGMYIGNNCGVGAHSQLWSHIKYGDTLEGCRFLSEKEMNIGDDVWFVGHCIVSPIVAEDKSMAMAGSVVTKNMKYNEIYAGTPAKSLSDKIGTQFLKVDPEEKFKKMKEYLKNFEETYGYAHKIKLVKKKNEIDFQDDYSYFATNNRSYKKTKSKSEIAFMNYLLPSRAKFVPIYDSF